MVAWPVYSQEQSQDIEVFLREKTRSGRDELNVSISEALHIGWSKHIFHWLVEASALCMNIVANKLKTPQAPPVAGSRVSCFLRDKNLTKRRRTKPGNLEPEPEPNDETKNFKQVIDLLESCEPVASDLRLEVKYTVD